jgi:hypothetical protein
VLQQTDEEAPARLASIGVLQEPIGRSPRNVTFNLRPVAVPFMDCSRPLQFRLRAVFPDGRPYTNFDDQCVCPSR